MLRAARSSSSCFRTSDRRERSLVQRSRRRSASRGRSNECQVCSNTLSALPFSASHTSWAVNDTIGASSQQGSAYLFTYIGGQWYPQQKLTAGDGATNDHFGVSVALSGDTMAIGAYRDTIGANTDQGSVYVFVHPPCPALTIAPASLPNGLLGAPYNQQFTVSNDDDAELNVTVSKGELPPGLTLDNNTGQLSGAPTATGTYRFTITITFYLSGCGASRDYALTITAPLCGATVP